MYLADQFVEVNPRFRGQTDTLILYEAVTNKYGYTFNDYQRSIEYYLQKGDDLKKIHTKAKDILTNRRDEVDRLIAKESGKRVAWWALDSLQNKSVNHLWKEPFLRSVRWLVMQNDSIEWNVMDTVVYDIPRNPLWWNNNTLLLSSGSPDSLYPLLIKDYLLNKENTVTGQSEKKSGSEKFSEPKPIKSDKQFKQKEIRRREKIVIEDDNVLKKEENIK